MSTQYTFKRGDRFSLGGTVSGLPSATTARCQIRNPARANLLVAEFVVTLGTYVDAVTPQSILINLPSTPTTGWPVGMLNSDVQFTDSLGTLISSKTFTVNVVADVTYD